MIDSWGDINVSQYQEIFSLKYIDKDDYDINMISILKDVGLDELEDLSIDEFNDLIHIASFIKSPPKSRQIKDHLIIDDVKFYKKNISDLTIGEFVDMENLIMDLSENLSVILTIMFRMELKPSTTYSKQVLEPYGDWIYHRSHLFEAVTITDVYYIITEYIKYRTQLFENYSGLFNTDGEDGDDDGYEEVIEDETGIQKRERLKAEATNSSIKKWGWDTFMLKLAKGDALKLDEVSEMSLIQGFNVLSIQKELDI